MIAAFRLYILCLSVAVKINNTRYKNILRLCKRVKISVSQCLLMRSHIQHKCEFSREIVLAR
jgi:hypothetical protein